MPQPIWRLDHAASGNFILLFSDGEDNASHTDLRQAIDMCQRRTRPSTLFARSQPSRRGLEDIGGTRLENGWPRVFYDETEAGIDDDLRTIEADLRNQYRLVYKPAELKQDGSYHHIELKAPERVDSITIRSGYYAPGRPQR